MEKEEELRDEDLNPPWNAVDGKIRLKIPWHPQNTKSVQNTKNVPNL